MDERTRRGKSRIKLGMTLGLGATIVLPMIAGTGSKEVVVTVMAIGIGGALWAMTGLAMTYRHSVTEARARRAPLLAGLAAIDAEQGGQVLSKLGGASAYNQTLAKALLDSGEASSMADALSQLGLAGSAAVAELHGQRPEPAPQQAAVAEYPDDFDEDDYTDDEDYPHNAVTPPPSPSTPPASSPPSSDLWGA